MGIYAIVSIFFFKSFVSVSIVVDEKASSKVKISRD